MEKALASDPPIVSQIADWARENPQYAARVLEHVLYHTEGGVFVYLPLTKRYYSKKVALAQAAKRPA